MKVEKANKVVKTVIDKAAEIKSPLPRTTLAGKPDTVEISGQKKQRGFVQTLKETFSPFISNLNKATVKELEAMPMENFWGKAQEIICDSYGIPESLRAPIRIDNLPKGTSMMYALDQNIVYVSPQIIKPRTRNKLFSFLKHEYTHQKQNLNLLRAEGIGEQTVEELTSRQLKQSMMNFQNTFRNMPEEEFEKLKPHLGENYETIKNYRAAVRQGEEAEQIALNEIKEHDYVVLKQQFENFRQLVIREMGIISKDSPEAEHSKEIFNSIFSVQDIASLKTALSKPHEQEAYLATGISYIEYFIKKLGF